MKKCIYAGDVADEYCKECDGCTVVFEGQERKATDCAGYQPGDEEVESNTKDTSVKDNEAPFKEEIMNPPVEEEVKLEPVKETKSKNETTQAKKEVAKQNKKTNKEEVKTESNSCSKVKSIRIMSGLTREINGTYYKFTYEQENEINADATVEQIEAEKEKLWAVANAEVDKQLEDVVNNLK